MQILNNIQPHSHSSCRVCLHLHLVDAFVQKTAICQRSFKCISALIEAVTIQTYKCVQYINLLGGVGGQAVWRRGEVRTNES